MVERSELNGKAVELPYIFGLSDHELRGMNAQESSLSMLTAYGTALHEVYHQNSSLYTHERDGQLYRAGFALTSQGIDVAVRGRGEIPPAMPNTPEMVEYYLTLTHRTRTRPHYNYGIKLALLNHETPLLEAVEAAQPGTALTDGDRLVLYDGLVDAYMMLSEATRLRQTMKALGLVSIPAP